MEEKIGKEVAWSDLRPHGMAQIGPECKLCEEVWYFFEHNNGPQMRFWSPIRTKRHNLTSTVPPFSWAGGHFSLEIYGVFWMRQKISKDVAWSDLRPHGMAQMGPECKLCEEMYYFLNTRGPPETILKPDKAPTAQPLLDRTSVVRRENWDLVCFSNRLAGQDGII